MGDAVAGIGHAFDFSISHVLPSEGPGWRFVAGTAIWMAFEALDT